MGLGRQEPLGGLQGSPTAAQSRQVESLSARGDLPATLRSWAQRWRRCIDLTVGLITNSWQFRCSGDAAVRRGNAGQTLWNGTGARIKGGRGSARVPEAPRRAVWPRPPAGPQPATDPGARLFRNPGPPGACTLSPGGCHILARLYLRRDGVRACPCPLAGHRAGGEAWWGKARGSGHPAPPDELGDTGGRWGPGWAMSAPRALHGLLGEGPGGAGGQGPLGAGVSQMEGRAGPGRGGVPGTQPPPQQGAEPGPRGCRRGARAQRRPVPRPGACCLLPGAGPWRGWGCLTGPPPLLGGRSVPRSSLRVPTPLLGNLACWPEHTPDSVFHLSPSCPGVSGRPWGPSKPLVTGPPAR